MPTFRNAHVFIWQSAYCLKLDKAILRHPLSVIDLTQFVILFSLLHYYLLT